MRGQISDNQMIWAVIAAIVVIDALWAHSIGIKIAPDLDMLIKFGLIVGINVVYVWVRPHPKIAALAASIAQLAAFTAAGAVLSYLTVTSRFPLIDQHLARVDAAFGVNWVALFDWVQDHPNLNRALDLAYRSGMVQVGVLLILLNILGQLERAREFVWLFVLTLLIVIPIAWLFPAESAWVYFGVTDRAYAYHLADFTALRAGQMHEISMARVNGLATFPSFHAALGLILIYATRGLPILFPASIALNTLMIASTPTVGGHYLIDIVAGLAVVPLSIVIVRWSQREALERPAVGGIL